MTPTFVPVTHLGAYLSRTLSCTKSSFYLFLSLRQDFSHCQGLHHPNTQAENMESKGLGNAQIFRCWACLSSLF